MVKVNLPSALEAAMAKAGRDLGIDFYSREPVNAQRAANKVGGAGKILSALPPAPPSKNEVAVANILNTPTPPAARLAPLKKAAVVDGKVAMVPSKAAKLPFLPKEKAEATITFLYKKFSNPKEVFSKAQYAAYKKGDLDDSDLREVVIKKTKALLDKDINKKFTTNAVFSNDLYDKVYDKYEQ
jgi:hypothetical protein